MKNILYFCPVCKERIDDNLYCIKCGIKFPTVKNIPILINEDNSIFCFNDYQEDNAYTFFGSKNKLSALKKMIPSTGFNYAAKENYALLSKKLLDKSANPLILIIGGGVIGAGMDQLLNNKNIKFIHTDVSLTTHSQVICDAHDLPFKDETFDGVIVQAVLEHVVDPYRCVEEIHRVLTEEGIVYAETPFMQQVHGGAYDFTRFTWLGHRRLFRRFEEIQSGCCCGPGMALADSWYYFFRSFTQSKTILMLLRVFSAFTSFFWKYFDYYLRRKPNALDASSGNYFMGIKKENYLLPDKELIKLYHPDNRTSYKTTNLL